MSTVPGDRFIRTLTHYLDSNVGRLQVKDGTIKRKSAPSIGGSSSNSQTYKTNQGGSIAPSSLYGIPVPYMSLLAAASPTTALTVTSFMPSRSTLTLDIHHLYFLLVQFEHLGLDVGDPALLGTVPEGGIVDEAEPSAVDETRSIMSVGSIASTLSLTTGWNFWNRGLPMTQQPPRTIQQDIEHIYEYFGQVSALKLQLNLKNPRVIQNYSNTLSDNIRLSLKPFKRLTHLELRNVHPQLLAEWPLQTNMGGLMTLVVQGARIEDATEVITPNASWMTLKRLSLADNNIISLDTDLLDRIRSVTDLDLSTNLLADVPAALACLYNLQSLQLANNMISSVTGINTVLGNIQELDLRGNRLTMLAGLERLWALERVDLRDNRIEDTGEVGRLASLPNIEDVWVQGNPFTQLNPDYRIQLFTAFKQQDIDIKLDGSTPSFAERRRIGARDTPLSVPAGEDARATAAEPAKITKAKSKRVVKLGKDSRAAAAAAATTAAAEAAAITDDSEEQNQDSEEGQERHLHRAADLEQAAILNRRKSVTSRRRRLNRRSTQSPSTTDDESQRRQRSMSPNSFRRKIESMRQEAGTEWLRVLQEMDLGKAKTAAAAPATTAAASANENV
ncbi:hypothetical protein BX666DRAFT_2026223 [Dichotomocladium elegans]|nr:hypothetical protein BX666DRAFT_2026223 [Dichotomocladium elegans]